MLNLLGRASRMACCARTAAKPRLRRKSNLARRSVPSRRDVNRSHSILDRDRRSDLVDFGRQSFSLLSHWKQKYF